MSNQLKVKVIDDKVILPDNFNGIDTSNMIASTSYSNSAWTYTATQDCIIIARWHAGAARTVCKIDDIAIYQATSGWVSDDCLWGGFYPLKAGQVFSCGAEYHQIAVYALKY